MKIDCHVHSEFSGDSKTPIKTLAEALDKSALDAICLTDHSTIAGYHKLQDLTEKLVICGQEQKTIDGELIGIFISSKLPAGLKLLDLAKYIRDIGGLVIAPHPLDPSRNSIGRGNLMRLLDGGLLDAVEVFNAKSKVNDLYKEVLAKLAEDYNVAKLSSSDCHVAESLGSSYIEIETEHSLDKTNFLKCLASCKLVCQESDPVQEFPVK